MDFRFEGRSHGSICILGVLMRDCEDLGDRANDGKKRFLKVRSAFLP
ncbi:hypothetical protein [Microcoleus sp. bin38.metabat.b11b12b14.051]|nr:hypothetical protein [Microcoleus sp. bin38.metabat.b11b12b14.051]